MPLNSWASGRAENFLIAGKKPAASELTVFCNRFFFELRDADIHLRNPLAPGLSNQG